MSAPIVGPKVAARVLCARFPCLGREVARAVRAGADWIHADVMDDARSLTAAPLVCAALRRVTRAPVDVHLMVKPVDAVLAAFAKAGAHVLTFHPEASDDVRRTVARAKELGCKVGLALEVGTPLSALDAVIEHLDVVVVVTSLAPDWAGRRSIPAEALARVRTVRARIAATGRAIALEVDGGVEPGNAADVVRAGADVLVAGSPLFGSGDYAATVAALKGGQPARGAPSAGGLA